MLKCVPVQSIRECDAFNYFQENCWHSSCICTKLKIGGFRIHKEKRGKKEDERAGVNPQPLRRPTLYWCSLESFWPSFYAENRRVYLTSVIYILSTKLVWLFLRRIVSAVNSVWILFSVSLKMSCLKKTKKKHSMLIEVCWNSVNIHLHILDVIPLRFIIIL